MRDRHRVAQPPDASRRHRRGRQDRRRLRPAAEEAREVPARASRRKPASSWRSASPRACVFLDTRCGSSRAPRARSSTAQLEARGARSRRLAPACRPIADACGAEALKTLPRIEQIFVNCRVGSRRGRRSTASCSSRAAAPRRRSRAAIRCSTCRACRPARIVYKGMVMPQHLAEFYPDLKRPAPRASVAVFHQRFSTNTLPQWRLAHPFRYLAHNGEINTIEGNRNWARGARPGVPLAAAAGPARTSCRWCRCTARTRRASTTCSKCC